MLLVTVSPSLAVKKKGLCIARRAIQLWTLKNPPVKGGNVLGSYSFLNGLTDYGGSLADIPTGIHKASDGSLEESFIREF